MTTPKPYKGSSTRRWHRTIGLSAALFILFLVITGLGLNHTEQLGLAQRYVSPSWLLRWYGLGEPDELRSYAVNGQWLSFTGSSLYLDGKEVTAADHGVGGVKYGDWLVAASSREILLLSRNGEVIERMPWEAMPAAPIDAIGLSEGSVVAVQSAGKTWLAGAELLHWTPLDTAAPAFTWSSPETTLPAALKQAIIRHHRGEGMSLERLMLDLHSGRIFGRWGMVIYDVLALFLGFSAVSGLILWWRTRGNGQNGSRN